ncbi:MAG: alpha/beta fold hydrolase [Pseudomonadota bacterium]
MAGVDLRYPAYGRPNEVRPDQRDRALGFAKIDMSTLSAEDPLVIAHDVKRTIDHYFDPEIHDRIVLIGYSAGAPILRYALMMAYGQRCSSQTEAPLRSAWATGEVPVRVVYLAGILRGWSVSTAMPILLRAMAGFTTRLADVLARWRSGFRSGAFINKVRKGAPFIIRGRLMQADLRAESQSLELPFEQVICLGTRDELMSPMDCVELAGEERQLFIELPATGHTQMLFVDDTPVHAGTSPSPAQARAEVLRRALTMPLGDWRKAGTHVVQLNDINDYVDDLDRPQLDAGAAGSDVAPDVKDAVLVLHGIRDNGYWTKRIARQIKEASNRPYLRAPSPTYGFFSMFDFIRPSVRWSRTTWFMEEYADVRECYPNAKVSFVGHSNGTYLAARAMQACDLIKFKNVVFAGSVVRRGFEWPKMIERQQLEGKLLNLKGTRDFIVLFLPGPMEVPLLNRLDVGGAGFHGFHESRSNQDFREHILAGGHGAGISERAWPLISAFINEGKYPSEPEDTRSDLVKLIGWIGPKLTYVLLAITVLVLWLALDTLLDAPRSAILAALFLILARWVVLRV